MSKVTGSTVLECQTYGHRGQRLGLNLCVFPSLLEPECLCISECWSLGQRSVKT